MTKEFKAGDKVKVVDKGGNTYIELDATYTVKGLASWGDVILEELPSYAYAKNRFELVPVVPTNGFGPDGKPMNFTKADAKTGMRFVMQDGAVYIGIGDDHIADKDGFCADDVMQLREHPSVTRYTVVEVYDVPTLYDWRGLNDTSIRGDLLWQRTDAKREALEAKVATLKAQLAEAEAALSN